MWDKKCCIGSIVKISNSIDNTIKIAFKEKVTATQDRRYSD